MINSIFKRLAHGRRLARPIKAAGQGDVVASEREREGNGYDHANLCPAIGAGALLGREISAAGPGVGPKSRAAILRMYSPDSPASMSIHEESTVFAEGADDGECSTIW